MPRLFGEVAAAVTQYEVTFVREFRYDGARARYLSAELDVAAFKQGSFVHVTRKWTDFDGDNAYRDMLTTPVELAYMTGFEPGIGRIRDLHDDPKGDYYFADHLGTTRKTYGPSGGSGSYLFTAFGELRTGPLNGGDNRYGYVGAHGYQAHDEMPYLHLGARYYDPFIGRFLQRDPIGITGGLNIYGYAIASPTSQIDPTGMISMIGGPGRLRKVGPDGVMGLPQVGPRPCRPPPVVPPTPAPPPPSQDSRLKKWKAIFGGLAASGGGTAAVHPHPGVKAAAGAAAALCAGIVAVLEWFDD